MLVILAMFLGINTAHADQFEQAGYVSAQKLVALSPGAKLKVENGLTTIQSKQNTFLSQGGQYVADWGHSGVFDYIEIHQMGAGGTTKSMTTCYHDPTFKRSFINGDSFTTSAKKLCRTQTEAYCKSLNKHISDTAIIGNLHELQNCADIVDKINFDSKDMQAGNALAMDVIQNKLKVPASDFENHSGRPSSIRDLLFDYYRCNETDFNKWGNRQSDKPKSGASRSAS